MTDSQTTSQRSNILKLRPGAIRQIRFGDRKWVVITPTSYRMLDSLHVYNCQTLYADASELVGLLPPDELDATEWRERYTLPEPCINEPTVHEPFWDDGRWFSRHIESGVPKPAQQPDSKLSIKTRPGVIRQCPNSARTWVIVSPKSYRMMDETHAARCTTLAHDPSVVIGMLPPDERDSTVWCERYALSKGCINHPQDYEPVWDGEFDNGFGRWLSRSLASDHLYDVNGTLVSFVSVGIPSPQPQPAEPDQPPTPVQTQTGEPVTDDSQRSLELRPGIIRKTTIDGNKWVVVDSTHWRWLDSKRVNNALAIRNDKSTVVGLLPPDELNTNVWSESFTLPFPCINNELEYEPHWDSASAAWLSRHRATGHLYDMKGRPIDAPKESLAAAAVRIFKKYW